MSDGVRMWLVGLGVVVIFASLFGLVYQIRQNGQQAADYHASNMRQQAEIERLLHYTVVLGTDNHATVLEIQALQQQVASVILALPAADKYLGALAAGLENQLQSICNRVGASCSNLPVPLPGAAPPPRTSPPSAPPAPAPPRAPPGHKHHGKG